MTNDLLNEALSELGENLANNLSNMGVENIDASDGLTTLADAILDIPPSVGGLNLISNIALSCESNTVCPGVTNFVATLTTTFDDTSLTNVDLIGKLTGATILLKDGDTIIGNGVTNNNGIANIIPTSGTPGNRTIKAIFEGTNNFNGCESTGIQKTFKNGTVLTPISTWYESLPNKQPISVYFLLTDHLNNPVSNKELTLTTSINILYTRTTNSDGMVNVTFGNSGTEAMYLINSVNFAGDDNYCPVTYSTPVTAVWRNAPTVLFLDNTPSQANRNLYCDSFISTDFSYSSSANAYRLICEDEDFYVIAYATGNTPYTPFKTYYKKIKVSIEAKSDTGNCMNIAMVSGMNSNDEYQVIEDKGITYLSNTKANYVFYFDNLSIPTEFGIRMRAGKDGGYDEYAIYIYSVKIEEICDTDFCLSVDKTSLSYYHNETATLTVNYSKGAGYTIELYNGNTKLGNMTDNNNGTYSYTYNSAGVGDITLTAVEGTNRSNSVLIEDCIKIGFDGWTGSYNSGTDTYNYIAQKSGTKISPNITFPRAFDITFKFKDDNSSAATSGNGLWFIGPGDDTDNGTIIGTTSTSQRVRVYDRNDGTNTSVQYSNSAYTLQTWTDARIYCDGTNITISVGGKTASGTLNTNANSLSMILGATSYTNYRIAEFKIKPYSA